MTTQEFSLEFDLMYNNISSNQAPGLSEYEKSLFLTQAQEALVLDIYSGKLGSSFESTEEVTDYLSPLVKQATYTTKVEGKGLDSRSVFFNIDTDIWFKTGEKAIIKDNSLKCGNSTEREVDVVPVTQDTLYRTKNSPFRGPNERRILRLDCEANKVELISKYPIESYTIRYLSKPEPIILENLPEGLTINDISTPQTCKLSSAIHRAILIRAVSIAKSVWGSQQ
jgi:hypothetical protein